jgi:hypothetical protein
MRILILPSARNDLSDGFKFYERQEPGVGDYFLESLFSDIESLRLYAGVHPKQFVLFFSAFSAPPREEFRPLFCCLWRGLRKDSGHE